MHLLFVTLSQQRIGGVARSANRIVDGLRRLGHQVRVAELDADSGLSTSQAFQGQLTGTLNQEWTRRVGAAIALERPDLLVGFYGSQGGFAATAAARLAGLPVVTCLRGNDVNSDFFSPIGHHLVAFAIERADAVTVVSREMAQRVAAFFGVEASFIANTVDREAFYHDPAGAGELRERWQLGDRPVVGLFGEFKPSKGLSILPALESCLVGATTLLVGKVRPESRREVPAFLREIPYIEDLPTLRAVYSLCELVLQPSVDDGMPNTILEAMACERTVLASPVGGLPDLIRHGINGFLAPSAEWPTLIAEILAAPRPELGRAAREMLTGPEAEALAYSDLFERVLAARA